MQDAGNQYAASRLAVKHQMPAVLHAPQAGTDIVTRTAQRGIIGQHPAAGLQTVEVADSLVFSPSAKGVCCDCQQVGFGALREPEEGHG